MKNLLVLVAIVLFFFGFSSEVSAQKASLEIKGNVPKEQIEREVVSIIQSRNPKIRFVEGNRPDRTQVFRVTVKLDKSRESWMVEENQYLRNQQIDRKIDSNNRNLDLGSRIGSIFLPSGRVRNEVRNGVRVIQRQQEQNLRAQKGPEKYKGFSVTATVIIEQVNVITGEIISKRIGFIKTQFERRYKTARPTDEFCEIIVADDSLQEDPYLMLRGSKLEADEQDFRFMFKFAIADSYNNPDALIIGR